MTDIHKPTIHSMIEMYGHLVFCPIRGAYNTKTGKWNTEEPMFGATDYFNINEMKEERLFNPDQSWRP